MDVSACVLSKVAKQPVALTGRLLRKKELSNGSDRDQVKGKEATPASVREGSFKHSRFGGDLGSSSASNKRLKQDTR